MHVDYETYKNIYGGTVSENKFKRLEIKASSILNQFTFNRIEEVTDSVVYAVCELIDYLDNFEETEGKEIASETTASHSVSYNVSKKKSEMSKQKEIISRHLGHTVLMYRGVGR